MEKYLYLTKPEWVEAWVTGGRVPLSLASSYLAEDRHQTLTPDENKIDKSTHSLERFPIARIEGGGHLKMRIGKYFENNQLVASDMLFDIKYEDGVVLCLSNRRSNFIAKNLGKLACVRIKDVFLLKKVLDEQIGSICEMKPCEYTETHLRNHFLKSALDSWQDEYRLFWKNAVAQEVEIPPGIGERERIRCR